VFALGRVLFKSMELNNIETQELQQLCKLKEVENKQSLPLHFYSTWG
jgi:hypothetical protein